MKFALKEKKRQLKMGKRGRKGGGKNKRKRDDGGGRVMMEGVRRFEPIQTIIANLGTAEPTII